MQMVARAVPRAAHIADDLPLLHLLSGCDTDAGTVGVQRVKRSIMLYLYVIPIASAPRVGRVCNCHLAARCRRALPSPHSLDTAPTRLRAKYPTTAGRILPRRMVRRFLRQREAR